MRRSRGNPVLTARLRTLTEAEVLSHCQAILDRKIAEGPKRPAQTAA